MVKKPSKRAWRWILAGAAVVIVAFIGIKYVIKKRNALPEGIASGNGRIEGKLVDISAREPLRVKEILVDEGALVKPGQVLVKMDTVTLDSQLAEANAAVQASEEKLAVARANITKQKSEIDLADVEADRSKRLVEQGAGSQRELDVRKTKVETTKAGLSEVEAMLATATENVEVARKNAATVQTRIDDATLRSPVTGRVLYRLAEPGEVLAAGGKSNASLKEVAHTHEALAQAKAFLARSEAAYKKDPKDQAVAQFARTSAQSAENARALAMGAVGGLVGGLLAFLTFNGMHSSTMNWASFSQMTFAFTVTPQLMITGIVYGLILTFIAGILPGIRAARLPITAGLREL